MNGNLIFDQNRLQVQDLVGTTGGGQLKFGGFLAYQQGLYGDFTAAGKDIRVRYLGISATADTTLDLQGIPTNMLLSGNVQITRFIIGRNVVLPASPGLRGQACRRIRLRPPAMYGWMFTSCLGRSSIFRTPTRIGGQRRPAHPRNGCPASLGRINVTDGTAIFAGTTYRFRRGEIFFDRSG